jgi:hypothetical protein
LRRFSVATKHTEREVLGTLVANDIIAPLAAWSFVVLAPHPIEGAVPRLTLPTAEPAPLCECGWDWIRRS